MPVGQQLRSANEELEKVAPEMVGWFDVHYQLDMEVGCTIMTVAQLLALREGDVVKLNRQASEELVLRVQTMPVASAEVVVGERLSTVTISRVEGKKTSGSDRS